MIQVVITAKRRQYRHVDLGPNVQTVCELNCMHVQSGVRHHFGEIFVETLKEILICIFQSKKERYFW